MSEPRSVRAGEHLDVARLEPFLRTHLPNLPTNELRILQFPTGASNLTYAISCGDVEVVLRRPPMGPVAPKAHDMEREFRILEALHPHFRVVPKPLVFSDDRAILGAPFFVMERRHGVVLNTTYPEGVDATPELGAHLSEQMVDVLVELHQIDYRETPLAQMTKPDGFMARQVEGWISRYQRAKTDEVAGVDELMRGLLNETPVESDRTIIHYDYKFNNAMFNNDLTTMVGLFDWEMATVGDPLADLGAAMSYWVEDGDSDLLKYGMGQPPITVQPGFMTRDQFVHAYASKSGRDVSNMTFYLKFAYFKLAVIVQQIYYRYRMGQTTDERFQAMNLAVASLVEVARTVK